MKFQLGIAACLLAGCAMQPTQARPRCGAEMRPAQAQIATDGDLTARLSQLVGTAPLRLAVEHLPPDRPPIGALHEERRPVAKPAVAPPPPPRASLWRPTATATDRRAPHSWLMHATDFAAARDPLEGLAVRFLEDLMSEDQRRLRREFGVPALMPQSYDMQSPGLDLPSQEAMAEDQAAWFAEHGDRLLRRPLRKMLQGLPAVSKLEVQVDGWKRSFVPLAGDPRDGDADPRLGRLSMRLRTGNWSDPLELAYMHSGFRVASSNEQLKLSCRRSLLDGLWFDLRARQLYSQSDWRVRADLCWELSPRSSLCLTAGDTLDFLMTSSTYSLFESPMDGEGGLLLHGVHQF